jgi:excinuclease UvrABC ATPase subunit
MAQGNGGKGSASIEQLRDAKLAEHEKLQDRLNDLRDRVSKDPGNRGLSDELRRRKQEAAIIGDEYCELARTAATMAGGKNHRPPL